MKKVLLFILPGVISLLFSMEVLAGTTIVLDPGHGGSNEGAEYLVEINSDVLEKDLNLRLAQLLKEELEKHPDIEVCLTREEDIEKSLKNRAEYAAQMEADIMVSLHFNASETHQVYGCEIWIPADELHYSNMFLWAADIEEELLGIGLNSRGIKTRLKSEGTEEYYGIIREGVSRNIPTVLVEHCFLDNQHDENFWADEDALLSLAKADARGILKYLGENSEREYPSYYSTQKTGGAVRGADVTPPELINVLSEDVSSNVKGFILYAEDTESRLSYYDYSLDGGQTWSDLQPWTGDKSCSVKVSVFPDTEKIIFRVYNGYDLYTQSDSISFLQSSLGTDEEKPGKIRGLQGFRKDEATWYTFAKQSYVLISIILGLIICLEIIRRLRMKAKNKSDHQQSACGNEVLESLENDKFLPDGLYIRTKIWFAYFGSTVGRMKLELQDIQDILFRGLIKIKDGETVYLDELIMVRNQFTAFDYVMDHWNQTLSAEFCENLYGILTTNINQEQILVFDDNVLQEPNRPLEELYLTIVTGSGPQTNTAFMLAGLVIFKECLMRGQVPFVLNILKTKKIIEEMSDDKEKKEKLHIVFFEAQIKYRKYLLNNGINV